MPVGSIDELAVNDWEQMVDVNFKGMLYGIAAVLLVIREQGNGHAAHGILNGVVREADGETGG